MCLELSTYSNLILSNGTVGTYPYFSNNYLLLGKVQLFAPDFTVISGGAGWIAFFPPDLQANNAIGRDVEGRQEGTAYADAHPHPGLSYREFENKPELCFSSIHSDKVKIQLAEKLP